MYKIIFFASSLLSFAAGLLALRSVVKSNNVNKNPLVWSTVDRGLLIIAVYALIGGTVGFMAGLREVLEVGYVPWVNFEFWREYITVYGFLIITIWVLMIAGLKIRRRLPDNKSHMYAVVLLTAVATGFASYAFGPLTDPKGFLIGMGQGIINIVLFGSGISMLWISVYCAVVLIFMSSVWVNFMTYGPFYSHWDMSIGAGSASHVVSGKHSIATMVLLLSIFVLLLLLVTYIVARWQEKENKLKEMTDVLKNMFGRYLSTEVMTSLIENPGALELGGEKRKVTVMMTDLRGFTAISEQIPPERVVQMLNAYFEVMVDVVLSFNGTINEFIGDSLLVVFGAPQEMPDRAERAIACAIAMQNAMKKVNEDNSAAGLPELGMGIGINEAEVVVGNIGSTKRSKYTVVGSGVNMASRIESYTVGGQILISDSVRAMAGNILNITNKFIVRPKGAEADIVMFEIGGIGGAFNQALQDEAGQLVPLRKEISVNYSVLEGKYVGTGVQPGKIAHLSSKSADMYLARIEEDFTNIRINLSVDNVELSSSDFYGKIMECLDAENKMFRLKFTAVPPKINAYFAAVIDHGKI